MPHEPFPVHVADIDLPFRCVDAGSAPGPVVAAEFERSWPSYRRWFLHQGEAERPSYSECRGAIRTHMPELLDDYDALVRRSAAATWRLGSSATGARPRWWLPARSPC